MPLSRRAQAISPSPTLTIDARAKEMAACGLDVINFGVGEPDFDTPEHIKEAAIEAIRRGATKYTPVAGTLALRKAVADKLLRDNGLAYEPSQIVVSVGAKHSLYNAIQVLCQEGDEVILPSPYWVSYLEQVKLAGATARFVFTGVENGFKMSPDDLKKAITPRAKLLILNSPSNPTGAVYSREEMAALAEVVLDHPDLYVISDEIYEKLIYDGNAHVSFAALSPEIKARTVVINGVSKAYAMTGWRIGYTASSIELAEAMTGLQSHSTSNPSSIAQAAAVAALEGPEEPIRRMVSEFDRRRTYMLKRLEELPGIRYPRPGGAFYLFPSVAGLLGRSYRGKEIRTASDLAVLLLEEARIAVVPGIAFGDDTCLRFSYATAFERIVDGMNRFEELVRGLD
ncbi:MAG: pyridoxal phosphate-dependent aminotransferase [Bacillota bacterium]|uniref:pyridoxal phosphate-dependent aminotransferase n=1 Tax=Desulforudis sp. DRI-14 TaxID=3459793 RepID=UPI00347E8034